MRLLLYLHLAHCLLSVCVECLDIPISLDPTTYFKTNDTIYFNIRLENLPLRPPGQTWNSFVFQAPMQGPRKELIPYYYFNMELKYRTPPLSKKLNNSIIYLELQAGGTTFYKKNMSTLYYDNNRQESKCLKEDMCVVKMRDWEQKVVITDPKTDEILFSEGDEVKLRCLSVIANTYVVWVNVVTGKELDNVEDSKLRLTKSLADGLRIRCRERFPSKPVSSARTITFKYSDKVTLITEPLINTTTVYEVGDHFTYLCKSTNNIQIESVGWYRSKDNQTISSGISSSNVSIVLDRTYNGSYIICEPRHLDPGKQHFLKGNSISTYLLLREPTVFNWNLLLLISAPILLLLLVAFQITRCRRKKKPESQEGVEVQNELYGSEYAVVYAQLYENRQGGAPPPRNRVEYTNIIGFLKNRM